MMVFCVVLLFILVLLLAIGLSFCWTIVWDSRKLFDHRLTEIEGTLWGKENESDEWDSSEEPQDGGDIVEKVTNALQEEHNGEAKET